eukprot:12533105-Alexandrium_andersonii.AAC.2
MSSCFNSNRLQADSSNFKLQFLRQLRTASSSFVARGCGERQGGHIGDKIIKNPLQAVSSGCGRDCQAVADSGCCIRPASESMVGHGLPQRRTPPKPLRHLSDA